MTHADFYSFAALLGDSAAGVAISARRLKNSALQEQYHSYHFILDDTSGDWQDIRVPLCGDEDPLSPFLRGDPFGAAGDGALDPEFLRGWQLKFVGADAGAKGLPPVTGSIELKDLACEGPGLVRALMEPWEEPVAGAPWRLAAGAAATAAVATNAVGP